MLVVFIPWHVCCFRNLWVFNLRIYELWKCWSCIHQNDRQTLYYEIKGMPKATGTWKCLSITLGPYKVISSFTSNHIFGWLYQINFVLLCMAVLNFFFLCEFKSTSALKISIKHKYSISLHMQSLHGYLLFFFLVLLCFQYHFSLLLYTPYPCLSNYYL